VNECESLIKSYYLPSVPFRSKFIINEERSENEMDLQAINWVLMFIYILA
jgi:hypothetical protein